MKRKVCILLALVLAANLFAGCGANKTAETVENTKEIAEKASGNKAEEKTQENAETIAEVEAAVESEEPAEEEGTWSHWVTSETVVIPTDLKYEKKSVIAYTSDDGGYQETAEIIVSPFKAEAYDLETVQEMLKSQEYLKGYKTGIIRTENSKYEENRANVLIPAYSRENVVKAEGEYDRSVGDVPEFEILFKEDLLRMEGLSKIAISLSHVKQLGEAEQELMHTCAQEIFGTEVADFLTYYPATEENGEMKFRVRYDGFDVCFSRKSSVFGDGEHVFYSVWVDEDDINFTRFYPENYQTGFSGVPKYFYDVFDEGFGPVDLSKLETFGAGALSEMYDPYRCTIPDNGLISEETWDDGTGQYWFSLDSGIYAEKYGIREFDIDYHVYISEGEPNGISVSVTGPCGNFDPATDTYDNAFFKLTDAGRNVLQKMFGPKADFSNFVLKSTEGFNEYGGTVEFDTCSIPEFGKICPGRLKTAYTYGFGGNLQGLFSYDVFETGDRFAALENE